MKKGYYIHFDAKRTPGVAKKIDMQIEEFRSVFSMEEINIEAKQVSMLRRLARLLPGGAIHRTYENALGAMENPDFIYMRRTTADSRYTAFIREIKRRWPSCKLVVEIFTYPYDKDEFLKPLAWPYYFKERHNRRKLAGYIDRYVTYSEDEEIFGVPTIRTRNGIKVDRISLPVLKEDHPGELHLIAVAFMQRHHGYERLIKGMWEYEKTGADCRVYCHLVGDGPDKPKYQKLVQKFGLENKVIFYPTAKGEELDHLYEKGDVAVSSLGWYKDGLERESTLKSREYMAKGFPMVSCCYIDGLDEGYPFVCQFPNDATAIDIQRIVDFYRDLLSRYTRREMQEQIRDHAKKVADMPVILKPVIDFAEKQEQLRNGE